VHRQNQLGIRLRRLKWRHLKPADNLIAVERGVSLIARWSVSDFSCRLVDRRR
jgi:hypothetical protein